MPKALPSGATNIPVAPATAPIPMNNVQKISNLLEILYLRFIFSPYPIRSESDEFVPAVSVA